MDSEFDEKFVLLAAASQPQKDLVFFDIPLQKKSRFVWVVLDLFNRAAATTWACRGELRFTKFGAPVLSVPLDRGVIPVPFVGGFSTTQGTGGIQPAIVYGNPGATGHQTSVEVPCWGLEVEADRVALDLISITDTAGTSLFVGGLRIQSQ